MEIQFAPNSVDEPNLLYKLQRKLKVFNTANPLPNRGYNLIASSSKYAIVFIASPVGTLSAYYLKQLVDKESEAPHVITKLQEKPTYIAASCDQEFLAVTGGQLLCVYRVTDYQNRNLTPYVTLKSDVNPGTFVSSLQWNPCIPDSIAIAYYDGTLLACQVSTCQIKKVQTKCRCLCWSPKGKQFVTGNSDGTLTQYKPDLTPAKSVPAPNLFESSPVEALAIYWISTFQFAVVYKNATDNSRPAVTIINTPKAGQPSCLNYEDICYSLGSNRPWYYYLLGLAPWNIILSSSSNSMEIATLGSADGANWMQWCQPDEARPELPLTDKKQENYPVGVCIDTCAIHQLPWGENETLPPMPLLLVVSQTGLLTIFNIINMSKQATQLCTPPQQLALPEVMMTTEIPDDAPPQPVVQAQAPPPPKPQPQAQPAPQPFQPPPQTPQPQSFQPTPQIPQPQSFQPTPQIPQPVQNLNQSFGAATAAKQPSFEPQPPQYFSSSTPQVEQKQPLEVKPTPPPVQTQAAAPTPVQKPSTPTAAVPSPQMQETYAAMKAEQERMKANKANQEMKMMLIKEVNDFQMELYKFMVKTKQTQTKLQHDLDALNLDLSLPVADAEQLKKECSIDDLRGAIVQLKLELVRMCAVVAGARTHAEANDLQEWTQADPLTTKRVASVKKLAYYVQNQVEQAHRALEHKWNDNTIKDPKTRKPGQYMIRPILDDVYQPLVKQQEILSRQQAVLRTLKNTLKEVDATPMFKSTSLLRKTPFRSKDPLSKLTKNILNMSLEPQNKSKEPLLNAQKLDALRDMLSNHKTIKVKPVTVELRQQLATMRLNYEKSLKEKATQLVKSEIESYVQQVKSETQQFAPQIKNEVMPFAPQVKSEPEPFAPQLKIEAKLFAQQLKIEAKPFAQQIKSDPQSFAPKTQPSQYVQPAPKVAAPSPVAKIESKQTFIKQSPINVPSFNPTVGSVKPTVPGLANVARTLFTDTDEPQQESAKPIETTASLSIKPIAQPPPYTSQQPFALPATVASPVNTRSVLKDLLQNKQANAAAAAAVIAASASAANKSDTSTFMGQKICSPSAYSFAPNVSAPTSAASSVFTAKPISDINNMFSKFQPQSFTPESKAIGANIKSSETGEPDVIVLTNPVELIKEDSISSLYGTKSFLPLSANKQTTETKIQEAPKLETKPIKVIMKAADKKENVPENATDKTLQEPQKPSVDIKEVEVKPIALSISNSSSVFASTAPPSLTTTSVTATVESQKPVETKTEVEPDLTKEIKEKPSTPISPNASSLFAVANASAPVSQPQSIFSSTAVPTSQTGSIFGTAQSAPATTSSDSSQKPSLFATASVSSASSIFGAAVASQPMTTAPSGSLFSTSPSPATSVFGSASIFGTPSTTSTSLFGATTTTPAFSSDATSSVFSSAPTTTSAFGASTTPPAFPPSPSSVFAAASTQPSIFASAASGSIFGTATTQASVFGTSTATTNVFGTATTQASVFGSPTTTASSIFGTATTQASIFGSPSTPTQGVFGTTTPTTQASVFGAPTSQASVFGSSATANQGSIFGTPPQASVFGTPTQAQQTSVFGTPTQTAQASVFGTPTQTTQSVFGTPPATTAQSGSLFGGAEGSMFAAASISTTSAPTQNTGGSIFGSSSGSVFGAAAGNTNVFGGKTSFSQSNPTAAAIFGGGAAFGQNQQQPQQQSNFWSGGNTTGTTGFGSGFGQQAATQASSIFGNTTGGSFTTAAPAAQPFGSPQTAFGGGDNKPSVFGTPQQQAAPAFGGSPLFGSKPAFGQSSGFGTPTPGFGSFSGFNKSPGGGFGAAATFGGGATFGGSAFGSTSPSKMFGGTPAPGFGSPTQSNATFENLATQNTLTFGNLAQQSGQQQQQQQAPSFNTSPSFTGWRG